LFHIQKLLTLKILQLISYLSTEDIADLYLIINHGTFMMYLPSTIIVEPVRGGNAVNLSDDQLIENW